MSDLEHEIRSTLREQRRDRMAPSVSPDSVRNRRTATESLQPASGRLNRIAPWASALAVVVLTVSGTLYLAEGPDDPPPAQAANGRRVTEADEAQVYAAAIESMAHELSEQRPINLAVGFRTSDLAVTPTEQAPQSRSEIPTSTRDVIDDLVSPDIEVTWFAEQADAAEESASAGHVGSCFVLAPNLDAAIALDNLSFRESPMRVSVSSIEPESKADPCVMTRLATFVISKEGGSWQTTGTSTPEGVS